MAQRQMRELAEHWAKLTDSVKALEEDSKNANDRLRHERERLDSTHAELMAHVGTDHPRRILILDDGRILTVAFREIHGAILREATLDIPEEAPAHA